MSCSKTILKKIPVAVSGFLLLSLLSCSAKYDKPVVGDNLVIFPSPPDTTRIQFLTSISNSRDIARKRSAFSRYVVGEDDPQAIVKPYGLAIHDGKMYVCDTILGGLEIIDLQRGTFEYFTPGGLGQLKVPINCCFDADGNLYVADAQRRQIVIFDENGKYLNSFGDANSLKPTDVSVFQDEIWVVDLKSHKINLYSKDNYELIRSIPDAELASPGYLRSPTNLHVVEDRVYVSDIGDFKIKIFTKEGQFLRSIGSYGRNMGQFVRPKGIALDKDLNLYVADAGFENVQIFDEADKLLMFFGGPYKKPGDMWLPAKVVIDYDNMQYFQRYVHDSFDLKYLVFVTNQYGPDKVNVYGYVGPTGSQRQHFTEKRN